MIVKIQAVYIQQLFTGIDRKFPLHLYKNSYQYCCMEERIEMAVSECRLILFLLFSVVVTYKAMSLLIGEG